MPNRRIQQLIKDRNIPPLKLPKPPDPVLLSGIQDPLLPQQIAEDLSSRNDVLEIAYYPPFRNGKGEFRVTFSKSQNFRVYRFYV